MTRARSLVVAVLVLLGTLGTVQATAAPAAGNYVALGDSFTAGPLIPTQQRPYGCLRSDRNYPHLVAPDLGLELRDVSCSGADTKDMTAPQGVSPGPNPPQFDALDAATEIVTLGIGGNDMGFSSIAEDCFTPTPLGTPCQDRYVVDGRDEISERIAAVAPKVAAVLAGIAERAPNADVYVVGYLPIFPPEGIGCWPTLPIAWDDVPYLRAKQHELNAMLATEAADAGVTFVDAEAAGQGHDACQPPVLRWVEPAIPASPAAPVHPNLFGMEGTAAALRAALGLTPSGT